MPNQSLNQETKTLYSTRNEIPQYAQEFFSNVSEDYKNTIYKLNTLSTGVTFENIKDHTDQNEYLGNVMFCLQDSNFYAIPKFILLHTLDNNSTITTAGESSGKKDKSISYDAQENCIKVERYQRLFDNNGQEISERTLTYKFFPDKTYQVSMKNKNEVVEVNDENINLSEIWQKSFESLITITEEKKKSILTAFYKIANDPYNILGMNCDLKQCKLVTALKNGELDEVESGQFNGVFLNLLKEKEAELQKQNLKSNFEFNDIILNYSINDYINNTLKIGNSQYINSTLKIGKNNLNDEFYKELSNDYKLLKDVENTLSNLQGKDVIKIAKAIEKHEDHNTSFLKGESIKSNAIYNALSDNARNKLNAIGQNLNRRESLWERFLDWFKSIGKNKVQASDIEKLGEWTQKVSSKASESPQRGL